MLPLALILPALGGLSLLFGSTLMDFSPTGRAALTAREGCELVAYRDSVGVWTIACGVTSKSGLITVTEGLTLTQAQADALNARAYAQYAADVRRLLARPVEQNQFDALVSLAYNIGVPGFAKSTVLRRLNAGDVAGAAEAILMWDKPAAIVSRRRAEYDQFRTPYAVAPPKARRGDRAAIRVPSGTGPAPASGPAPAAPVPPPRTVPAIRIKTPPAPSSKPAPSGGLSSVLARLGALFGRVRT